MIEDRAVGYFSKELTRTHRAWDELEKSRSGIDIVDFRLAPSEWRFSENPFRSRGDVLRHLQEISDAVPRDTQEGELIGAKADASLAYINYLKNPKRVPYEVGMEKMLGVEPFLIPYPEISFQFDVVKKQFRDIFGLDFTPDGWKEFINAYGATPEQSASEMQNQASGIMDKLTNLAGISNRPKTIVKIANRADYWMGWAKGTRLGNTKNIDVELRVNRNKINQGRWFEGKTLALGCHELAHGVQAQGIVEADKTPFDTTIPGPEQWVAEAWAMEVTRLAPEILDGFTPEQRAGIELAVELDYLANIAYYWGQYRQLGNGEAKKNVVADLCELLPHEKKDRVSAVNEAMTIKPNRIFYMSAYGDGGYSFRGHVESLSPQNKIILMHDINRRLWTPAQFKARVVELHIQDQHKPRYPNGDGINSVAA